MGQADGQTDRRTDGQIEASLNASYTFVGRSINSGVTRGRTAPGDTLQGVDTRTKKNLWANLQRMVDKRGRTDKKRWG